MTPSGASPNHENHTRRLTDTALGQSVGNLFGVQNELSLKLKRFDGNNCVGAQKSRKAKWRHPMTGYRCYFLGFDGKIISAEEISSDSFEGALSLSRRIFVERGHYPSFELWQGNRKLHVEMRVAN
jgi:hypothetical protein